MSQNHVVRGFLVAAFAILALGMQAGCRTLSAQTSKPLFNPDTDTRFDQGLVGTWLPDYLCIKLRPGPGKSYLAGGGLGWPTPGGNYGPSISAHLVPIGKYEYLFAGDTESGGGTSLSGCCRVTIHKQCVVLEGLNIQTIIDDLKKHPDAMKYTWTPSEVDNPATQPSATQPSSRPATQPAALPTSRPYLGNLEITDEPKVVRDYIEKHQDDPEMFSEPVVLYRIAP